MARLVRFLSKAIGLVLFICAAFFLSTTKAGHNTPLLNINNGGFKQWRGVLYYRDKAYTGKLFELFANGDTAKLCSYNYGRPNGLMLRFYPGKKLAEERFFEDGKKEGVHKGWWPGGKLKFEYHFVNDEYEGTVTEWYDTGRLFRLFNYAKGHEKGSEKMWWDDGTIRANYVIVNGQKFGLFGQKLCTNNVVKTGDK